MGTATPFRHLLSEDLLPGFPKFIAKLGVSDRDQCIRSLFFASLGEFSSPEFRHHDIDLMPEGLATMVGPRQCPSNPVLAIKILFWLWSM